VTTGEGAPILTSERSLLPDDRETR
jgi:hypothetical protein